jgi:hypothetical protein
VRACFSHSVLTVQYALMRHDGTPTDSTHSSHNFRVSTGFQVARHTSRINHHASTMPNFSPVALSVLLFGAAICNIDAFAGVKQSSFKTSLQMVCPLLCFDQQSAISTPLSSSSSVVTSFSCQVEGNNNFSRFLAMNLFSDSIGVQIYVSN